MEKVAIDIDTIKEIIIRHGHLAMDVNSLKADSNLHDAGLTSLATVGVMLALEEHFDFEFPESSLSRKTFESMESIAETIANIAG